MAYINTAYLFKCQTCRHFRSDECNTFCENGECYSPNIRMIPTADVVEVRHGKWKPTEPDSDVRFFCSECETEISTSWDYDNAEMWRYCPNCGAKMDGRSDTDDTK